MKNPEGFPSGQDDGEKKSRNQGFRGNLSACDAQELFSQEYLLSSGLYRRPRNCTGSCLRQTGSWVFTTGREFHPAPKVCFCFHTV